MTAYELVHKFDVFRNLDVRTDRGLRLPLGRSVVPWELILSSRRSTLVLTRFFPGNFLNKSRGLQVSPDIKL